ncbi:MAG: DUF305 domain-containing protein [Actinophytocola sp.]|nr:DUF305 domain-containing protein [Actinophytocola sp.]
MSDEATDDGTTTATPGWARAVIFGGAGLALLLVGAIIGLLIGRAETAPAAAAPRPGPVDIGFAQDMSLHHLQAVTMGNIARERGHDDTIRQIGYDIAATQQSQVGWMQGWLALWGQPGQAPGAVMTWMPGGHGMHGMHDMPGMGGSGAPMPGMATDAELAKLRSLSGEKFDVYFLQLMLRHHQGGASMAEYAAKHANVGAVRALASSMVESQGAEMELMRQMLAARGAKPLPF